VNSVPETTSGDPLSQSTLIYVAPRTGTSGVSDYADDILTLAHEVFPRVIEVRCGGAGQDSFSDVRRGMREVQRAIRSSRGPVLLHTELSGGALLPFWALTLKDARRPNVRRSSTLHDAPLGVWLPFRSRGIGKSRLLVHAIHFPTMPLLQRFERRVLKGVRLSALTESGARAIEYELRHEHVDVTFLPPPVKPELEPPVERPLAVGLFGYVYRGKGFDSLAQLRLLIDPRITIRVAGRGTEQLDAEPGVDIVGPVEGADEDRFFESVRAILMPYSKRSSYGPVTHVASSVLARSIAYGTPAMTIAYPGLANEAAVAASNLDALAEAVNDTLFDDQKLEAATRHTLEMRDELTLEVAFATLSQGWREALSTVE
jgi:hypothetical protein